MVGVNRLVRVAPTRNVLLGTVGRAFGTGVVVVLVGAWLAWRAISTGAAEPLSAAAITGGVVAGFAIPAWWLRR